VSYCLNPNCPNPTDPMNVQEDICQNCRSPLLVQNRYRVIRPLGNGGFGQTFEVKDCANSSPGHVANTTGTGTTALTSALLSQGTLKVLKVLNPARLHDPRSKQKLVSLFQQEASVLSQLHHPGIPKVEPEAYFPFWYPNCQEPLHCLVMEEIEGSNLKQWQENRGNQPIAPMQAIGWLKQLVEILDKVHAKQYFHRDIKPSNIMLKPDGQLVLIDFGAVRECTQTYVQQQHVTGTVIGSPGYSPIEQLQGRSVPQSDFFALGRTFVHLLTGRHPLDLEEDPQTGKLMWQNSLPHRSNSWLDWLDKWLGRSLIDLIDELIEPSWQKRPKNTRVILQRLKKMGRSPLPELATGAAVLLGLGAIGIYWYVTGVNGCSKIGLRSFPVGDNLSCGEEILIQGSTQEKQKGVDAFAAGNYPVAVSWLEKAWQNYHDPETLIYLNNARLAAQNVEAHTIAIAAPLNNQSLNSLDTAKELLRGVAQAQDEVNGKLKPGETGLKVLIANDVNDPAQGQDIAKVLVSKKDVLAVIGHYASDVTLKALPVYQQHHMVLISPGSTSEELSTAPNPDRVFFRTVPTTNVNGNAIASHLISKVRQQKVAVFFDPNSIFSSSLHNQFRTSFGGGGGQVVKEFNLSDPVFQASTAIDQARQQGATAFVILPDANINPRTFDNAIKLIRANKRRYWMMGGNTLYSPKTLEFAGQEAADRLVAVVPWHHLSSPNPKFAQAAQKLWGGNVSSRTALAYDAARALITALNNHPSRTGIQKALADPNFQANDGATGIVSFQTNGNRKEPVVEWVKVVPSNCSPYGFRFIPTKYPAAQLKSLERCRAEQ
jgi:eukaryotic-like serine/threonine-protein kinase